MKAKPELLLFRKPLREVRWVKDRASCATDRDQELQLEEAYQRGRREGEKALSEQLLLQRTELIALQQGLLRSLRDTLPSVMHDCESGLVALAVEVAQKLVAGFPISTEMVEAAVREALQRVESSSRSTVLLHEDDLELLRKANSPVLLTELGGEQIQFQAAKNVTRGGCLVQTRFGLIDARRETKLEAVKKSLEV